MEAKQVAVKKEANVAKPVQAFMPESIDAGDFEMPRINLIQKMSKKNNGKDASYGELRDNLNNKLLGSLEQPMEFIPIHMEKKWIVSERDDKGRYQFKSIEAYDGQRPFYSEDKNVKNMLTYEVYVLIPSEVEGQEDMPYIINFQSTSSRAGKKLATQMYMRNMRSKKPPYAAVMSLVVSEETTDDNTYGVMDVSVLREASKEELSACEGWLASIHSGQTKAAQMLD